eukprot:jgi/Chlat1/5078/Chrsp33S05073
MSAPGPERQGGGHRKAAGAAAAGAAKQSTPTPPVDPIVPPCGPYKQPSTRLFRILNPELFVRPNPVVGFIGTAAFIAILGSLWYEKREYDRKQLQQAELERAKRAQNLAEDA